MKWHKCDEEMPGQDNDLFFNKEISSLSHPGFIVCFNHGDDEPFLARCYLKRGRFELAEWCHALDMKRPKGQEECFDKYQETYWDDEIVVTHWAYLEWPDDVLDED